MCDDTAARWPAEDLACEPGQEPRGCRYIEGDVGDPTQPWRYCQGGMLPGHRPGSLAKPPYCADHMRLIATPLTEAGRRSRAKFLERIAEGDDPKLAGMNNFDPDGMRMPVDFYVSRDFASKITKGFTHD